MLGHIKVDHTPAVMSQHYQDKQDPKCSGRNREEIDGNQLRYVIVEECLPGLRRGSLTFRDEARDGPFRDKDTQLQQLAMNPWCTPKRVRCGHLSYQVSNLASGFWPADAFSPRNPSPEEAETLSMPGHNGLGLHND
jgi:hypothetical protein